LRIFLFFGMSNLLTCPIFPDSGSNRLNRIDVKIAVDQVSQQHKHLPPTRNRVG
jgi:hypothetical protein